MQLNDGLILRSIRDEHDIDRYAAFGAAVVDAIQGATCARLPRYRPDAAYEDFLFVEDQQTGEIVSTVCLLPWRCVYEGVVLNVAMLEMVATHPAYRQRGLVRAQIERFHQMTAERGFDCCIIEGIPYYYRQYGYAYAIEHGAYDSLPAWRIPSPPAGRIRAVPAAPGHRRRCAGIGLTVQRSHGCPAMLYVTQRRLLALFDPMGALSCADRGGYARRPSGRLCVRHASGPGTWRQDA